MKGKFGGSTHFSLAFFMSRTACLLLETLTPLIAMRRSFYSKITVILASVLDVTAMRINAYTSMNN